MSYLQYDHVSDYYNQGVDDYMTECTNCKKLTQEIKELKEKLKETDGQLHDYMQWYKEAQRELGY